MATSRNAFLERVRRAIAEGDRAGGAPPLPQRGGIGYQGAEPDLLQRFCAALSATGGQAHVVADAGAAAARVLELIPATKGCRVLLGRGPVLDRLELAPRLYERGVEVATVDAISAGSEREVFFQADVGISGVAWAVAETGTLVLATQPAEPRSLSLLPPVHIAIVARAQLLPDLFDLFAELEPDKGQLPACLSLITGPSKTGDIELKLVTGVHGPGELHVCVIADGRPVINHS
jgi:L-lactate utilization protein LutC